MKILSSKESKEVKEERTKKLQEEIDYLKKIYGEELAKYKMLKEKIESRKKEMEENFSVWLEDTKKQRAEIRHDLACLIEQKDKFTDGLESEKIDVGSYQSSVDAQIKELASIKESLSVILGENKRIYADIKEDINKLESLKNEFLGLLHGGLNEIEEQKKIIVLFTQEFNQQKKKIDESIKYAQNTIQKMGFNMDKMESQKMLSDKMNQDLEEMKKKIENILSKLIE